MLGVGLDALVVAQSDGEGGFSVTRQIAKNCLEKDSISADCGVGLCSKSLSRMATGRPFKSWGASRASLT